MLDVDNKIPYSLKQIPEFFAVSHDRLTDSGWLSNEPERKDLLAFVRGGFKSKRLQKKFLKTPDRYKKRVILDVWEEWEMKRWWKLGRVMAKEVYHVLGRESFARRIFQVSPLVPFEDKEFELEVKKC